MKHEFVFNGEADRVALIAQNSKEKQLLRQAFNGNQVTAMDLKENGDMVLVFCLKAKDPNAHLGAVKD